MGFGFEILAWLGAWLGAVMVVLARCGGRGTVPGWCLKSATFEAGAANRARTRFAVERLLFGGCGGGTHGCCERCGWGVRGAKVCGGLSGVCAGGLVLPGRGRV